MKHWKIFLALVLIGIVLMIFYMTKEDGKFVTVKIGNATVKAEVADTVLKQMKGLMFRKSLPEDEGMWFDFKTDGYPSIWMPNMSFPIDIVWVNSDFEVVHIKKNAQPCIIPCKIYRTDEKARYVLEVNANFTDLNGIEIGTKVKLT